MGVVTMAQVISMIRDEHRSKYSKTQSLRLLFGIVVASMAALGASNPTVLYELSSNVSGLSNGACSIPPQVTSFSTTISSVYLYFDLIGSVSGDSASVTFYRP